MMIAVAPLLTKNAKIDHTERKRSFRIVTIRRYKIGVKSLRIFPLTGLETI